MGADEKWKRGHGKGVKSLLDSTLMEQVLQVAATQENAFYMLTSHIGSVVNLVRPMASRPKHLAEVKASFP